MTARVPTIARLGAAAALVAALAPAGCTQAHVVLGAGSDGGGGAPSAATTVSIANFHACAIAGGALYCWGANDDGRLGVGDTQMRLGPARVGADRDWRAVAAAGRHTVALKTDGSLWAWGANDNGQLGLGDFSARQAPARVGARNDWTAIASRFNHACALAGAAPAALWCWGENDEGQLGLGDDGAPLGDQPAPALVDDSHGWLAADTGQGHSCALRADGTLWCWGRNSDGELGQGAGAAVQVRHAVQVGVASDWQVVQSGQSFSGGLRAGALYLWGSDATSMIPGAGTAAQVDAPVAVPAAAALGALSLNTFGGCALAPAGAALCWGRNVEGQLGLGDTADRPDLTPVPAPAPPASLAAWQQLSMGRFSLCGVAGGTVYCVGDNRSGQLGQGDLQRRNTFGAVALP